MRFLPKIFFHPAEEVGHFQGDGRLGRQQAGDYTLAFGDLNFLSLAEEIFHHGETVPEIADGRLFHVIHFSITQ